MLSNPSMIDQRLTVNVRSTEGLISVAVYAVDILLCYHIHGAKPSVSAERTILAAIDVYADALPHSGPFHNALVNMLHQTLGVTFKSSSKVTQEKSGPENYAHLVRAVASGDTNVNIKTSQLQLLRTLCIQLHLCNYLQSIRLFSLLRYMTKYRPEQNVNTASQVFIKQVSKHLRNVIHNIGAPDVLWEYKIYQFLSRRLLTNEERSHS